MFSHGSASLSVLQVFETLYLVYMCLSLYCLLENGPSHHYRRMVVHVTISGLPSVFELALIQPSHLLEVTFCGDELFLAFRL